MKMQNILGALLLAIASQAVHAMEENVYNTKKVNIHNATGKLIELTLIDKNNTPHIYQLQPNIKLSIKTTPFEEIIIRYENSNTAWFAPIPATNEITDIQYLNIFSDGAFQFRNYNSIENKVVFSGYLQGQQVHEDV